MSSSCSHRYSMLLSLLVLLLLLLVLLLHRLPFLLLPISAGTCSINLAPPDLRMMWLNWWEEKKMNKTESASVCHPLSLLCRKGKDKDVVYRDQKVKIGSGGSVNKVFNDWFSYHCSIRGLSTWKLYSRPTDAWIYSFLAALYRSQGRVYLRCWPL